jgi:hypothetical protein
MCLNLRIEIRGINFPANLVVMGTQGLDVILGMNWLHRNQATVSCDKRTVNLVSPSRKEVVTELFMLTYLRILELCRSSPTCSLRTYQACHPSVKLSLP